MTAPGTASSTRPGSLPATIPVFPLSGVLLLPRGHLPLNVFEPRYRNMTQDALASDRLIGMVQPRVPEEAPVTPDGEIKNLDGERLDLYANGCAGRIAAFEETADGRYLIALEGVSRFALTREIETGRGYRRFAVDWSGYASDLAAAPDIGIDRPRLVGALRGYFRARQITADWDAIDGTADERLVTALAMACPFAPAEKQALLEAPDLAARGALLTAIAEMAAHDGQTAGGAPQ